MHLAANREAGRVPSRLLTAAIVTRALVPGFDLRAERKAGFVAAERARGRCGITGGALADDTGPLRGVVPGRKGPEEPEHRTGEVRAAGARGDHDGRRYRGLEEAAGVGVPAAAGRVLGRDARVPTFQLDLEVIIELQRRADARTPPLQAASEEVLRVLVDEHQSAGEVGCRLVHQVLDDAPLSRIAAGVLLLTPLAMHVRGGALRPLKGELVDAAKQVGLHPLDGQPGADLLLVGGLRRIRIGAVDHQGDARLQGPVRDDGNAVDPEVGVPDHAPVVEPGLKHCQRKLRWTDGDVVEAAAESRVVPVEEVDLVDVVAVIVALPDPGHAAAGQEWEPLGADPVLTQSDLIAGVLETIEVPTGQARDVREHAIVDELDPALVFVEALGELPLGVVLALVAEAELVFVARGLEADLAAPLVIAANAAAEVSVEVDGRYIRSCKRN